MTLADFKTARKRFVGNVGPGGLATLYGLYNLASAVFPEDTHSNPALWSRLGLVFAGLALCSLGYYWLKKAFAQRRFLECPSCRDWLTSYGQEAFIHTGRCRKCGTQIISEVCE